MIRRVRNHSGDTESLFFPVAGCVIQGVNAPKAASPVLILFSLCLFVAAALLFIVELMMAKMALPVLGGAAAVWNTCLVFYQGVLLAGYLYAHAATRWLGRRWQIVLHSVLACAPLAILPVHIPRGWAPPTQASPVLWILAMLSVAVGMPFFVLSASTPLLQRWFSQSGHPSANDPYFLYAASNTGSLLGLLSYPLLLEPWLRLSVQSRWWSYGYLLFAVLAILCGALVWRQPGPAADHALQQEAGIEFGDEGRWSERLRWIALAFVPSSLMIGTTTALTTDVPPIPLFWVLPLALYLLSFVLVFARRPPVSHEWLVRRLPFLILGALVPTVSKTKLPLMVLVPLYLLALFAVAMVCHAELARGRPRVSRLTEFYLWISVGGVLGGVFNSLVAPLVFPTVIEFPLALIFAALLRPPIDQKALPPAQAAKAGRNDWILPLALGTSMVIVILGCRAAGLRPGRPMAILIFGYSILWCLSFGKRPLRFAFGVAALLAASSLYTGPFGKVLHTERSFFGVSRVTDEPNGRFRVLFHGGTIHGLQHLDPLKSRDPLGYYSASGPAAGIFRALHTRTPGGTAAADPEQRIAIVGLGAGTMACYLQPGDSLAYYEIDPVVKRIAANPQYFTYLSQCASQASIALGDARLELRGAPDASYDLIVLDAFSGDTIPMHLLTREALALYLGKLSPRGILAFHISNLYLDLAPTLAILANDAGLICLLDDDTQGVSQAQIDAGRFPSRWMVMARNRADLGALASDARWRPASIPAGTQAWTDDYSNLLRVIRWN